MTHRRLSRSLTKGTKRGARLCSIISKSSRATLAEEAAEKEYKTFMNESEVDKAMKSASLRNTKTLITKRESDLVETQTDLKNTQEELDAALAYYEKLKPSCVESGVSYEDRVKRREEEIESLVDVKGRVAGTEDGLQ